MKSEIASEASAHQATFEKIQAGEINTPEDLGEAIVEDHEREKKEEQQNSEILSLYNKKSTHSTLSQVKEVLAKSKLTESDKEILYNYEGEGYEKTDESKTGLLHEFFTPYWLCYAISEIIKKYQMNTNKVLDPATGTGRLLRYLDFKKAYAFEVNKTNYEICQKIYSKAIVYNQPFETAFLQEPRFNKLAKKSWLGNDFDLVVSNPPYGQYAGEYKIYMPKVFTRFEFLFIAMSMSLVKSGGYGVYVLPHLFMNNGNLYNAQKNEILKYSEFVDAIRLPNGIFASTDIGVDLVIFKKK